MIEIRATVDADQATDAFKRARRDIGRRQRSGMKRAGERTILPRGRREVAAQTPVATSQVVVKTTGSYAYMTVRGVKQGRIVGLLNYGGTVKGPIRPKHKKAVAFGNIVVSQVTTARHYKPERFLERARDEGLQEFGEVLLPALLEAFDPLEHTP